MVGVCARVFGFGCVLFLLVGCAGSVTPASFSSAIGSFEQQCKPHFADFRKMEDGAKLLKRPGSDMIQTRSRGLVAGMIQKAVSSSQSVKPHAVGKLTSIIKQVRTNYDIALDNKRPLQTRYYAIQSANYYCKDLRQTNKVAKLALGL